MSISTAFIVLSNTYILSFALNYVMPSLINNDTILMVKRLFAVSGTFDTFQEGQKTFSVISQHDH